MSDRRKTPSSGLQFPWESAASFPKAAQGFKLDVLEQWERLDTASTVPLGRAIPLPPGFVPPKAKN